MPHASVPVARRAVLGAGLALPLAACAPREPERPAAVRAEVTVLVGAIAAEQDLVALYEAARTAGALPAARLDPVLDHHRAHLAALRKLYVPGSGSRAGEGGAVPSPSPATVPSGRSRVLAELRAAEARAARDRLAEVARADPGLAQVLASIGACEAGHAAVLGSPA
ncbi:hypothetical protein BTM25_30750 [Actinomadura rubteroloni]|uniref:DUF4439 domain-containing protein n=1 Tax=Actinomadura rubteroloni TaxID=1926885 RepID=A0A2P4UHF0_9ACTN|nr:hypothetical protein [Actinomadura rubteroloni]POM24446.1 hypothetical protein BTM25_30750 [Actinomadura rubteroloni]